MYFYRHMHSMHSLHDLHLDRERAEMDEKGGWKGIDTT